MISTTELKMIDPEFAKLSETEAIEARELLYRMAELALKNFYEDKTIPNPSGDSTLEKDL